MVRVTVLELPATWGEPAGVLASVEGALAAGAPTDVVLLPELSLTGYVSPHGDFDLTRFRETIDGPTAGRIADLAQRRGVHLVAPLVRLRDGATFNTMIVFGPDAKIVAIYEKRRPWIPERVWATRGTNPYPIFRIGDVTLTIAICYDLHFLPRDPVARDALRASDLLLFPSAWVEDAPSDSRVPLLRALARRFGVAIANANWAPGVVRLDGQGGSCILDARGETLAVATEGPAIRRVDATIAPRMK